MDGCLYVGLLHIHELRGTGVVAREAFFPAGICLAASAGGEQRSASRSVPWREQARSALALRAVDLDRRHLGTERGAASLARSNGQGPSPQISCICAKEHTSTCVHSDDSFSSR